MRVWITYGQDIPSTVDCPHLHNSVMSSISVITSSLSFNLVICIRVAGTFPWKMMTGGQCSSRSCRLGVCNKLPLSSQLMWVSCTDAPIMAQWLFVPTSSAGQTRYPFCFGRVLISPKCCFFFSLSGGFPQQCEKILLGLLSATHSPCGLNPDADAVLQSGEKLMHCG